MRANGPRGLARVLRPKGLAAVDPAVVLGPFLRQRADGDGLEAALLGDVRRELRAPRLRGEKVEVRPAPMAAEPTTPPSAST